MHRIKKKKRNSFQKLIEHAFHLRINTMHVHKKHLKGKGRIHSILTLSSQHWCTILLERRMREPTYIYTPFCADTPISVRSDQTLQVQALKPLQAAGQESDLQTLGAVRASTYHGILLNNKQT